MQPESIRQAVEAMERELSLLAAEAMAPSRRGLTTAWGALVSALDLQPARRLRNCPECNRPGFIEATRCGFCWAALTPPDPSAP